MALTMPGTGSTAGGAAGRSPARRAGEKRCTAVAIAGRSGGRSFVIRLPENRSGNTSARAAGRNSGWRRAKGRNTASRITTGRCGGEKHPKT